MKPVGLFVRTSLPATAEGSPSPTVEARPAKGGAAAIAAGHGAAAAANATFTLDELLSVFDARLYCPSPTAGGGSRRATAPGAPFGSCGGSGFGSLPGTPEPRGAGQHELGFGATMLPASAFESAQAANFDGGSSGGNSGLAAVMRAFSPDLRHAAAAASPRARCHTHGGQQGHDRSPCLTLSGGGGGSLLHGASTGDTWDCGASSDGGGGGGGSATGGGRSAASSPDRFARAGPASEALLAWRGRMCAGVDGGGGHSSGGGLEHALASAGGSGEASIWAVGWPTLPLLKTGSALNFAGGCGDSTTCDSPHSVGGCLASPTKVAMCWAAADGGGGAAVTGEGAAGGGGSGSGSGSGSGTGRRKDDDDDDAVCVVEVAMAAAVEATTRPPRGGRGGKHRQKAKLNASLQQLAGGPDAGPAQAYVDRCLAEYRRRRPGDAGALELLTRHLAYLVGGVARFNLRGRVPWARLPVPAPHELADKSATPRYKAFLARLGVIPADAFGGPVAGAEEGALLPAALDDDGAQAPVAGSSTSGGGGGGGVCGAGNDDNGEALLWARAAAAAAVAE